MTRVDLDAHQRAIRVRLRADGKFFIVQTMLRGQTWLRVSLMNPLTTSAELEDLIAAVRAASHACAADGQAPPSSSSS